VAKTVISSNIPTITSGEKIVTVQPSGVKATYDIVDPFIAVGTIASADWSTGKASYTGFKGQECYDNYYLYKCIEPNLWSRFPIMETRLELYLNDINDTVAKTSVDLNSAYPSAQPGQRVRGTVNYIYEKVNLTDWIKTPRLNA